MFERHSLEFWVLWLQTVISIVHFWKGLFEWPFINDQNDEASAQCQERISFMVHCYVYQLKSARLPISSHWHDSSSPNSVQINFKLQHCLHCSWHCKRTRQTFNKNFKRLFYLFSLQDESLQSLKCKLCVLSAN